MTTLLTREELEQMIDELSVIAEQMRDQEKFCPECRKVYGPIRLYCPCDNGVDTATESA